MAADVRIAAVEDAPDLARLLYDFNSEYDEPTPTAAELAPRIERFITDGEAVFLAAGEGPDGFAELRFRPTVYSDGLDAYLEELYVVPAMRGQGLGRALLERGIEVARSRGATRMDLTTAVDDTAARGLYDSAGFTNLENGPDGPSMLYYEREL